MPAAAATVRHLPQDSGREPETDKRIAVHEAAHCLAARVQGAVLGGATIDPNPDSGFSGLTWGPNYSAKFSRDETAQILEELDTLRPCDGERRDEIYQHVHCRLVELVSGTESELMIFGNAWPAISDRTDEMRLARLICSSEESCMALIAAAAAEARAILKRYEHVLHALADELLKRRTLNGSAIDETIAIAIARKAAADEADRRRQWRDRIANAAVFQEKFVSVG